jgi:hypothetical protein
MLSKLTPKIELLANLLIVVVGCLLLAVLIKDRLLTNQNKAPTQKQADSRQINGKRLPSLEIDWKQNPQTMVLAISTTCHFCTESAPFYKSLAQNKGSTRLVAVLPQSLVEGQQYLAKLGVPVDDVRQASLSSMGVSGTPTLMLVDRNGVVVGSWVGRLGDSQENEVLSKLRFNSAQVGEYSQSYPGVLLTQQSILQR